MRYTAFGHKVSSSFLFLASLASVCYPFACFRTLPIAMKWICITAQKVWFDLKV
jgi:hypothetical protein